MCFSTFEQQYIDTLAERLRADQASLDANARFDEVSFQPHDPVDAERGLELVDAAVAASGLPNDSEVVQDARVAAERAVQVMEAMTNGLPRVVAIEAARLGLDPRRV